MRPSCVFAGAVLVGLVVGPATAQSDLRPAVHVSVVPAFDGEQAAVDVGPCSVSAQAAFTLRCRLRTTRSDFCTALMARDGDAVGLSLVLGRKPGHVSFEAWSWQSIRLQSLARIDDGAWHTIEVPYDPVTNVALLMLDGAVHSAAELGAGAAETARLRLGNNIGTDQPFRGELADVEVRRDTTHLALVRAMAPVLPGAARERALRELRGSLLPKHTAALAAAAGATWPARREAVRGHVADCLGLVPPPASVALAVREHGELVRDDVRVQRVSWVGFAGHRATGWLWTPRRPAAGRRPAVLCPHGHWPNGARDPVVQARCASFAQFGWTALAVDSVHVEHVASGVNSVGAMTWHNQRALAWLRDRADVDPERIGVTGASGGGQQTYYLMALGEPFAAAAPMVMACYFAEIVDDTTAHCGCNHVPRLAAGTDVPEMCAVWAPRPVMFGSVTGDWTANFPQQGLPELVAHWQRSGGTPPRSRHANEGHNYDRAMREEVYGFLHDVLTGPAPDGGVRQRCPEPGWSPFTESEWMPLLRGCPNVQLVPDALAQEYLARRPKMHGLQELAPGLDCRVARREITWLDADGAVGSEWRRGSVSAADAVPIPFRCRDPHGSGSEPFTVVVDPRGMASAFAAATAGATTNERTVFVDPRPYGEWARFRAAWQRNGILLGRGEGYQAAVDTALVCASLPGDVPVHLVGRGEAGVVALLAAHLCARIVRVVADDLGPTYAQNGNRLPLCPELLRYSDLPELERTLPPPCRLERRESGR